jgi:hypothetical protein
VSVDIQLEYGSTSEKILSVRKMLLVMMMKMILNWWVVEMIDFMT